MFPQFHLKRPNILKRPNTSNVESNKEQAAMKYFVRPELKDHSYVSENNNFLMCISNLKTKDQFCNYAPKYYVLTNEENSIQTFARCEDVSVVNDTMNRNIQTASSKTESCNKNLSGKSIYICQYCSIEFRNKHDLLIHIQTHNIDNKPFQNTDRSAELNAKKMVPNKNEKPDATKMSKGKTVWRRKCFVPDCTSNSKLCPDKFFALVPSCQERREKWFKAVNRDMQEVSMLTKFYCCEDHFDLRKDIKRWYKCYDFVRLPRAALNDDVVPHIFKKPAECTITSTETTKESGYATLQDKKIPAELVNPTKTSVIDSVNTSGKQFEIRTQIEEDLSDDTDWCIYNDDGKERNPKAYPEHIGCVTKEPINNLNATEDVIEKEDSKLNLKEGTYTIYTDVVIKKENISQQENLCDENKDKDVIELLPEKLFACQDCPSTFSNEDDILEHNRVWYGNTNTRHSLKMDDTSSQNEQEVINVETKDLNVLVEKDVFERFNNFQKALESNSTYIDESNTLKIQNKKVKTCPVCKKNYSYHHFKAHMIEVHSVMVLVCKECGAQFKCERYLRKHLNHRHNSEAKVVQSNNCYKCLECPKTFKNNDCLSHHIRNCHGDKVECDLCHSKLKSVSYLKSHMRRVHYNDGRKHRCRICFKEFKSPRQVKIHMINLHPETLHPCPNCIRLFCNDVQLKIHLKNCKAKTGSEARKKEESDFEDLTVD